MATKKKAPQSRQEVLIEAVSDIKNKFGKSSIMRLGDEPMPDVVVLPSGIFPLDVALGVGGYPRGRIVEMYGPEGGGKTTVALQAIAETQRNGGFAAFIDVEHALDPKMAAGLGVNIENLYVSQPDNAEQALSILDAIVRSGAIDIVILDSVAALTPQSEIDGNIGESGVGIQARLLSYALRRLATVIANTKTVVIFINQLRSVISTGYGSGPTETTAGGKSLKFYASIRMEVRRGKKIDKGDVTIGQEIYMKIVKNKVAPPFRTAHASLIYGRGVPTGVAVVDMAIDHSVIVKKGSWLAYKGETLGQGKEAVAKFLAKNPKLLAEVKAEIMEEVKRRLEAIAASQDAIMGADSDAETAEPEDDFAAQLEKIGKGEPVSPVNPVSASGSSDDVGDTDEILELDSE